MYIENLELKMSRLSTRDWRLHFPGWSWITGDLSLEQSRAEQMRAELKGGLAPGQLHSHAVSTVAIALSSCSTAMLLYSGVVSTKLIHTTQIVGSCWHLNWHRWPSIDIPWYLTRGSEVTTNFLTPFRNQFLWYINPWAYCLPGGT